MFKEKNYLIIIIFLAIVFFFVYSSLYWSLRPSAVGNDMWIFNTPDETANHFFIEKIAEDTSLKQFEPLNNISGELNLVHPRITTVVDNNIVPGSFLGFILIEGFLAKVFGIGSIPFIIPFFSILAIICFYLIIKKIFKPEIAFWSAVLLMIMPAFWYYNSRSLFNNILFIDFLIIGFYFLLKFTSQKKILSLIASGLLIGLALTIRTSDSLWVGGLVLLVFIFYRQKFKWWQWPTVAVLIFIPFIPILLYQNYLYGSPFTIGYAPSGSSKLLGDNLFLGLLKQFVMPFGFKIKSIFYNFYHYFVKMFWWYFWPAFGGGMVLLINSFRKKVNKKEKNYFLAFIVISLLIVIYYGSWFFFNNLMAQPLIGSSQVRYLMPIYIMSIPILVYFVKWFLSLFLRNKISKVVIAIILLIWTGFLSFDAVLGSSPESLSLVKNTVKTYHLINQQVRQITEDNSVIISSYSDKLFFPKRKVIFYWEEPRFLENIELIKKEAPIYFYSVNPDYEINYIVDNSYLEEELIIELDRLILNLGSEENLYKIH